MRKNAIPPQVLFKKLGLNLISPKTPYFVHDDVFIGGTPYHSKLQDDSLKKQLNKLSKEAENYSKKILVIHQGIDKYLPWEYELEIGDIPQNFDYYACGHVHTRIIDDFGRGKLVYPGSTEIWKASELGDYVKKKKGFYLVEMASGETEVEPINIEPQREFIVKHIEYPNLDTEIQDLKSYISKLENKPIVNLTVEGGNFNRGDVYEKINSELFDISLKIRPVFKSEDILNDEKLIEDVATLDPKQLLTEKLQFFDNEDIVKLAIELLNNLSNDKGEESEKIANKFYKDYFEDLDISQDDMDLSEEDMDFSEEDLDISLEDFDISEENLDLSEDTELSHEEYDISKEDTELSQETKLLEEDINLSEDMEFSEDEYDISKEDNELSEDTEFIEEEYDISQEESDLSEDTEFSEEDFDFSELELDDYDVDEEDLEDKNLFSNNDDDENNKENKNNYDNDKENNYENENNKDNENNYDNENENSDDFDLDDSNQEQNEE
jgi:DNA repair exonuclease SbcCD nuclease subunit